MHLNKVVYLQGRNNPTEIKTNKMKTLKRLHKNTSTVNKVGTPIALLIILPLLIAITMEVLSRQNIIF